MGARKLSPRVAALGGLFIWALVDAFLIPGMLRADKRRVEAEILEEIGAMRESKNKATP